MRLHLHIIPTIFLVALASSLPATQNATLTGEQNTLNTTRQGRTFDEILPFVFQKLFLESDYDDDEDPGNIGLFDIPPMMITNLFANMLKLGSTKDPITKAWSLDGYTIKEIISMGKEISAAYRQITSFQEVLDMVNEDTKLSFSIKKKFDELFTGPSADILAVASGIAVGISALVLLGLLITHIKLVKESEANVRSVNVFDRWMLTNEIEDTIPLISGLENALGGQAKIDSSTFSEIQQFFPFFGKVKEFFTKNDLFDKFKKLYRSDAVTPLAVLTGLGAGLVGALGLAFNIKGTSRSAEDRFFEDEHFDITLQGVDQLLDAIAEKLVKVTAEGLRNQQGRIPEGPRTINITSLVDKLAEYKKTGGLKHSLEKFFKGKTYYGIIGGIYAATILIPAIGLLIAGLAKMEKNFEDDYEDFEQPIFNPSFSNLDRTTLEIDATQIKLEKALNKLSKGLCGEAELCRELEGNVDQQLQLANLVSQFDKELGNHRPRLHYVLSAARKNKCQKYKC